MEPTISSVLTLLLCDRDTEWRSCLWSQCGNHCCRDTPEYTVADAPSGPGNARISDGGPVATPPTTDSGAGGDVAVSAGEPVATPPTAGSCEGGGDVTICAAGCVSLPPTA